MNEVERMPCLDLAGGELRVRPWPPDCPPPAGLRQVAAPAPAGLVATERVATERVATERVATERVATELRGPARLRWHVRRALAEAGVAFRDDLAAPPLPPLPMPPLLRSEASLLTNWRLGGHQGLTAGLPFDSRVHLALGALVDRSRPALVVVLDSGAALLWQRELRSSGLGAHAVVVTAAEAARSMPARARAHDLLLVDAPELVPWPTLAAVLDGSAACARLGFVGCPDAHRLLRCSGGLGPLLGTVDTNVPPRTVELRVPMPAEVADAYATAWHTFLTAYDRFAALQPNVGFGTFVQQARDDPAQRPALLAWHKALHLASWHAHKATLVADLLQRHRGERILVFTPDRHSTYALARTHLIAPVTAELPRTERAELLDAYLAGTLTALAGPRLLDLGVPEGSADVGILAGGGYGRHQRAARSRRVVPHGIVYELVSHDTVEVGRAHRWRGTTADATALVHRGGR